MLSIKKGKNVLNVPKGVFEAFYKKDGWIVLQGGVLPPCDGEEGNANLDDDDEYDGEESEDSEGYEGLKNDGSDEEIPDEISGLLNSDIDSLDKSQLKKIVRYFDIDTSDVKSRREVVYLVKELKENLK